MQTISFINTNCQELNTGGRNASFHSHFKFTEGPYCAMPGDWFAPRDLPVANYSPHGKYLAHHKRLGVLAESFIGNDVWSLWGVEKYLKVLPQARLDSDLLVFALSCIKKAPTRYAASWDVYRNPPINLYDWLTRQTPDHLGISKCLTPEESSWTWVSALCWNILRDTGVVPEWLDVNVATQGTQRLLREHFVEKHTATICPKICTLRWDQSNPDDLEVCYYPENGHIPTVSKEEFTDFMAGPYWRIKKELANFCKVK